MTGGTACQASTWLSDSSLRCRCSSSSGGFQRSFYFVSSFFGVSVGFFYHASHSMFELSTPRACNNIPSSGSTSFSLFSAGTGLSSYSLKARAGQPFTQRLQGLFSTAIQISSWLSDSSVFCKVLFNPFVGVYNQFRGLPVILSVALHTTCQTSALVDDVARIDGLEQIISSASKNQFDLASSGFLVSYIPGRGFGLHSVSMKMRLKTMNTTQDSACAATYWTSDSRLTLRIVSVSKTRSNVIHLVLSMQSQQVTSKTLLLYNEPLMMKIKLEKWLSTGEFELLLTGKNFAVHDMSHKIRFSWSRRQIYGSSVESSTWKSDSSLSCKAGAHLMPISYVIVSYTSDVLWFNFSLLSPNFEIYRFLSNDVSGSSIVNILGLTSCTQSHFSPSAKIGSSNCENFKWISQTSMNCKVSAKFGHIQGNNGVLLTLNHQFIASKISSMLNRSISINQTEVNIQSVSSGSWQIQFLGSLFSISGESAKARLNAIHLSQSAAVEVRWTSDSSVFCKASSTSERIRSLTLSVDSRLTLSRSRFTETGILTNETNLSNMFELMGELCAIGNAHSQGNNPTSKCIASVFKYDITREEWIAVSLCPTTRTLFSIAVQDDEVFLFGGMSLHQDNPLKESWSFSFRKKVWYRIADIPIPVAGQCTTQRNGIIFMCGGITTITVSKFAFAYNIAKKTWLKLAPMQNAVAYCGSVVIGNVLYVSGGSYIHSKIWIQSYDFGTEKWDYVERNSVNNQFTVSLLATSRYLYLMSVGVGDISIFAYDVLASEWIDETNIVKDHDCTFDHTAAATLWIAESSIVILTKSQFYRICMVKISSFATNYQWLANLSISYPELSLGRHFVPATASTALLIQSGNFGTFGATGSANVLKSGCEVSVWTADTSLVCKTAAGNRYSLKIFVSVMYSIDKFGSGYAGLLDNQSITVIKASFKNDQNVNSQLNSGSKFVSIVGRLCGSSGITTKTTLDSTCAKLSNWISESSVLAKGNSNSGYHVVMISANQQNHESETSNIVYAWIENMILNSSFITSSSQNVIIQGASLGIVDVSLKERSGASSCQVSLWMSDSRLTCKIVSITEQTLYFKFSMNSIYFHQTKITNYSTVMKGTLSSSELNHLETGSSVIEIAGVGFSTIKVSSKMRLGVTACENSLWYSSSRVSCKSANVHVCSTNTVMLSILETVSKMLGNITRKCSVDWISSTDPHTPASGGFTIVFASASIPTSFSAKIGSTTMSYTNWLSHSVVSVKTAAFSSISSVNAIVISCHNGISNMSSHKIFLNRVHSPLIDTLPRTGSFILNLAGRYFGFVATSNVAALGYTTCESSNWISDSSLLEKPSQTCSKCLGAVTVSILSDISTVSLACTFSLANASLFGKFLSTGSNSISILGNTFSSVDISAVVRLENTAASVTRWMSFSSSWCKLPAFQHCRVESVCVTHTATSIDFPALKVQEPVLIQDFIISAIVLSGSSSFKVVSMFTDLSSSIRLGKSALEATQWLSGTSMSIKLCSSIAGEALKIVFTAGKTSAIADYHSPSIEIGNFTASRLISSIQSVTASQSIMTYGLGLLFTDNSFKIRCTATATELSRWTSDSSIKSKTCAANLVIVEGVVSHQQRANRLKWISTSSTNNIMYTLNAEKIAIPISASVYLQVFDFSSGNYDSSLRCHMGITRSMTSQWNSESSLSIKVPAGTGWLKSLTLSVKETVHRQYISESRVKFVNPEIMLLTATDNSSFVVQGSSFGAFEPKLILSYQSVHFLRGSLRTIVVVLPESIFVDKVRRVVGIQMKLSLAKTSRLDGVTVSLVSPIGDTFHLLKNKCKGCYMKQIQFLLSDTATTHIPKDKCVNGHFRFDHYPMLREFILATSGDWKVVALLGAESDFATLTIQIDFLFQDYLGLIDEKVPAIIETWSSDSGLAMTRGIFNAKSSVPNVIISGQLGQNKAAPISALYNPILSGVLCLNFPESGSGIITIIGNYFAHAVYVGEKHEKGFEYASASAAIKIGKTSCEASPWMSQSSMMCKNTGRQLDDDLFITITVAKGVASSVFQRPDQGDVN